MNPFSYLSDDFLDLLDDKIVQYEKEFDTITSLSDAFTYLDDFANDMLSSTRIVIFTYEYNNGKMNRNYDRNLQNVLIEKKFPDCKERFITENLDSLKNLADRYMDEDEPYTADNVWQTLSNFDYFSELSAFFPSDRKLFLQIILSIILPDVVK